jgi:peptidylprolyl isomerase
MRIPIIAMASTLLFAADRYPVPSAPKELAVPPSSAAATASGLLSRVVRPGTGTQRPGPEDLVTVEYTLWKDDGTVLDSTARLDRPFTRPITRLLKGMQEGLQLMVPGEKRLFWMNQALTFNDAPGRPKGILVLEMELLATEPSPFKAPPDVAGPADGAQLLSSGLALRMLRKGKGDSPRRDGTVTVHYTGWTLDGQMFDSTWKTGHPATFRLDQVIKGWSEGLQYLAPGGKARFWVPEKMAYRGQPGKPAGTLVFDIELLEVGQ